MKFLKTTFDQKDEVKKLGAVWVQNVKSWACKELTQELSVFFDDVYNAKKLRDAAMQAIYTFNAGEVDKVSADEDENLEIIQKAIENNVITRVDVKSQIEPVIAANEENLYFCCEN